MLFGSDDSADRLRFGIILAVICHIRQGKSFYGLTGKLDELADSSRL
jgi:hypothetical protein